MHADLLSEPYFLVMAGFCRSADLTYRLCEQPSSPAWANQALRHNVDLPRVEWHSTRSAVPPAWILVTCMRMNHQQPTTYRYELCPDRQQNCVPVLLLTTHAEPRLGERTRTTVRAVAFWEAGSSFQDHREPGGREGGFPRQGGKPTFMLS